MAQNNVRDRAGGTIDDVDAAIIEHLQKDARIPNNHLAERVGIAPSTCIARVRSLIDRGVVTGFEAKVDPAALGLGLQALISVSVRSGARHRMAEFSAEMRRMPDVLQLFFLGGSEDFILHIAARDSAHVRDFVLEHLSAHPFVASTRTSMVFEHVSRAVTIP
ncbi:Lrp/AsnC family transcriptional regulator [Labedella populi]|uniref:Lrp/AsnC family transcriptional regulator n=1 Tax=Labedella populi TaxID=2498850 RepID=A0A3S4C8P1_9MICO|nr:Lrp/AsnC family transcriptional regulator [Labedella populi]RWZ64598.1 Lrp/AsnC family transcriptional regulator [Labedella populi]